MSYRPLLELPRYADTASLLSAKPVPISSSLYLCLFIVVLDSLRSLVVRSHRVIEGVIVRPIVTRMHHSHILCSSAASLSSSSSRRVLSIRSRPHCSSRDSTHSTPTPSSPPCTFFSLLFSLSSHQHHQSTTLCIVCPFRFVRQLCLQLEETGIDAAASNQQQHNGRKKPAHYSLPSPPLPFFRRAGDEQTRTNESKKVATVQEE